MLRTLSDRVKPVDPRIAREIPSRYDWLPLKLSEPNLGAPYTTDTYVLTSTDTGERGWAPFDNRLQPVLVNQDFDAVEGRSYLVDTTVNKIITTLPISPVIGNKIYYQDIYYTWDKNSLEINRNGQMIQGLEENFFCDLKGAYFEITFAGSNVGWRIS